jgi:hypothetical protein
VSRGCERSSVKVSAAVRIGHIDHVIADSERSGRFGRETGASHARNCTACLCRAARQLARLDVAIHEQLLAAVDGHRGAEAADRLCEVCVVLLNIDAAAISLIYDGATMGTLGCSSEVARRLDEVQFTVGEGPCVDSITQRAPVLVVDLVGLDDRRWPAFGPAMLAQQIRAVFALPVVVAGEYVGALDLFRHQPGPLGGEKLVGAVAAAEIAGIPLIDLLSADLQAAIGDPQSNAWADLTALSRAEVGQATGMLVAQLDIDPAEALVRLRAHAYATGRSATDIAGDILDRRLKLESD